MRIFLCDDSHSFGAVVGFWLEEADDLDLVGVAHDRAEAMAAGDDELAVDHVRQVAPGAKVVGYSGHEPHAAKQFVRGEPDLYLRKGDEPEHLIDALRELGD